ncbi:family S53 protease-like protein [Vararia minispora EC-137]|uniref:Family S53 protease-like protein n=1 Tax=Vararia minispora EC-137 TaxID=1314806 RepID=A0ACB8QEJ2_9AGAM|nr:family S53 protease-like protein [Vararia minispora EC-137]
MRTAFFFALSLRFALANPLAWHGMHVLERRDTAPSSFVKIGPAPPDQVLTLRLGLVQGDMGGLEERLATISSPSSPEFRQWLSKEEVEAFVAPKPDTVDAITSFLSTNGITSTPTTPARDLISITVTVEQANGLFGTQFDTFRHTETGGETVRTLEYSVPAALKGHIEFVHPTTTFPQTLARLPIATIPIPRDIAPSNTTTGPHAVPSSCASVVTPDCLEALYNLPATNATETSNTLGVSGYIGEYANQADLTAFLGSLRPDLPPNTTFALETLDGGSNPQGINQAGIEANLDIQYTVGVASGVPTIFYGVGSDNQDGLFGFLDLANHLLAQENPPHVLTTSYGANEADVSVPLYQNLCAAYMQLAARGISVLYASGDGGVAGSQSTNCTTFLPTFPSGCPYVTSVGATTGVPEVAAELSAGGFSNVFVRPFYQNIVVPEYLSALGDTNAGLYNQSGRAYPDIAAVGENVEIAWQGQFGLVGGTSCSSPIFASAIALLNDLLIAKGQKPLGFLNPFLYETGKITLNDISSGSNPGCGTNGFPARVGWDPVTGLGTPNFAALRAAIGV